MNSTVLFLNQGLTTFLFVCLFLCVCACVRVYSHSCIHISVFKNFVHKVLNMLIFF